MEGEEEQDVDMTDAPIKKGASPAKSPGKRARMLVAHNDIEFEIVAEDEQPAVLKKIRNQISIATPPKDKQPAQQ